MVFYFLTLIALSHPIELVHFIVALFQVTVWSVPTGRGDFYALPIGQKESWCILVGTYDYRKSSCLLFRCVRVSQYDSCQVLSLAAVNVDSYTAVHSKNRIGVHVPVTHASSIAFLW